MISKNNATYIGFIAVLLWSAVVGLIRVVAEQLGTTGGAAMIYTVATLLLFISIGPTKIKELPRRYLVWGGLLFVSYELCLSLSIGYANTSQQAIEVGMVNYLWPAFTMLFAIVFNKQQANWLIVPGFIIAIMGVCQVLAGEHGIDLNAMRANILDNPLSYSLAFVGALIWTSYCTVAIKTAAGKNGITLFFMLTALALWFKYAFFSAETMVFSLHALIYVALAAAATGFGYAAWNVGILHGNITLLAGASYFIPVFSAVLASALLRTALPITFWQGAALVCTGSILCWLATRGGTQKAVIATAEQV